MRVSDKTAYIYLFLTMTFWAGNSITARMFADDLPPLQHAFWRWVIASFVILIIFRPPLKLDLPIIWTYRWPVFWIGTTGIGAYNTLQYWALNYTTVSNVGLLQTTLPIVLCLLEWLVFKEKITRTQMLGMMVATIGVGVVLIKANLVNLLHLSFNFGDLIMVGAIFVYGIFSLLIRYSPKQVNQWSFLWVLFVIGALELLPLQLLEYQAGYRMNLTIGPILGLSYIIIGPALLAYKFYTSAVLTLGATRTGLFFYWLPIASVILAIVILGEPLQIYHLIGFVLVVFGLRLGLAQKEG